MVSSRPARLVDPQGNPISARPFSPQPPPPAELGPGTTPRGFFPPVSVNLQRTARAGWEPELTAFGILRAMSEEPMVQLAINDVKGQLVGMEWQVLPVDEKDKGQGMEKEIERIKAWMRMPDPLQMRSFARCLSAWIDEILITDALTLYPRYTVGGKFIGVEQIDGATIIPLVDDRGRYPLPPVMGGADGAFAFEQVKDGRVETQFYLNELMYRPKNPRPDSPYGRPPTEMVLLVINIAMRRNIFDLNYFTEGNIPEGLFSVPDDWTPEEIANYNRFFAEEIATASATGTASRVLKFVPPGSYHALKDHEWNVDHQEFIAREICAAFGVSPMPLVKMMNRATAETLEVSSLESGARSYAQFIAELLTEIVQVHLGAPALRVIPGSDETEDPSVVYERNIQYLNNGLRTQNSLRSEIGEDLLPKEIGDVPYVVTPSGPVPLAQLLAAPAPTSQRAAAPDNAAPSDESDRGSEPNGSANDAAAKDLARWRTFAIKRMGEGKPMRRFDSEAIALRTRRIVELGLRRAGDTGDVRKVFDRVSLGKGELPDPASATPARQAIEAAISGWLFRKQGEVIDQVLAALDLEAAKLHKDDAPPPPSAIADALDLDMESLVEELEKALAAGVKAGAGDTSALVEASLDEVPEKALEYARKRAAELVGMKRLEDGSLVTNPRAEFAINETLRSDIQSKIAQAIEKGWSTQRLTSELKAVFDPARAETIARTETGFAYNEGAAVVYEEADVEHVEILDGDGCLPEGHDDAAKAADGTVGVVQDDRLANGQIWTLAQFRSRRLAHPRCVRAAIPATTTATAARAAA